MNLNELCVWGKGLEGSGSKTFANDAVLSVMKENFNLRPNTLWQYFGTENGILTTYPSTRKCNQYDPRFR